MYEEIQQILERYSALLSTWNESSVTINNYSTLLKASIIRELSEELESLKRLFNAGNTKSPEAIKAEFKSLCRLRQARNQGTCLSYTALPEGDCNELYWEIMIKLFKPKTLPDVMGVLLPDVTRVMTLNSDKLLPELNELGQQRQQLDRVIIDLTESDLKSTLSNDISIDKPSVLTSFVIENNRIFYLAQMQVLPFILQKKLYDKLSDDKYANIKKTLYSHNKDLEQLQINIQFIS